MRKSVLFFIFGFATTFSFSQTDATQAKADQRIRKHYTDERIDELKSKNPDKWKVVEYYYTKSYIIIQDTCSTCSPFNIDDFDISKYEKYRMENERWEHYFIKQRVKLILLSINELEYLTPYQKSVFKK